MGTVSSENTNIDGIDQSIGRWLPSQVKTIPLVIDKIVQSYHDEILEQSLVKGLYERSNVWLMQPETKSKHIAPYPRELSDKIIKYYSFVGD